MIATCEKNPSFETMNFHMSHALLFSLSEVPQKQQKLV